MKKRKKCSSIFLLCFLFLIVGSCKSALLPLLEATGRGLDGSARQDKKVAIYRAGDFEVREVRNKAGAHSVIIFLKQYPSIKLRGTLPDENGDFFFTSLDYLAGSSHGWNEYRMDLIGAGRLGFFDSYAVLSVPEALDPIQISSGRIQRFDTRITGPDAVARLRDRHERISVLVEWMKQRENNPTGLGRKEFEKYWKPLLFPEISKRKMRPEDWKQEGDEWHWADEIRWNKSYTGRAFPEILRAVRDSGTMLRDWEEALPWVYVEYQWGAIMELLSNEITLLKKK